MCPRRLHLEENRKESLPNRITIDDVEYEYGDYIFRVIGFRPNDSGEYKIHNKDYVINGKELHYCHPVQELAKEECNSIRKLVFDDPPYAYNRNFTLPNVEDIVVCDSDNPNNPDPNYCYCNGCLFKTSSYYGTKLVFVPGNADEIEEISVPSKGDFLCIHIRERLPHLKKIIIPGNVRILGSVSWEIHKEPKLPITLLVDNIDSNILIRGDNSNYIIEYTGNANPSVDMKKSYFARLRDIIDKSKHLIVDVPSGTTDKELILRPFYYALIEVACEVILRRENEQETNAEDLLEIENLLSINITNPTIGEMGSFVRNWDENQRFTQEKFRGSRWSFREIIRVFKTIQRDNKVTVIKTKEELPFVSVLIN